MLPHTRPQRNLSIERCTHHAKLIRASNWNDFHIDTSNLHGICGDLEAGKIYTACKNCIAVFDLCVAGIGAFLESIGLETILDLRLRQEQQFMNLLLSIPTRLCFEPDF